MRENDMLPVYLVLL